MKYETIMIVIVTIKTIVVFLCSGLGGGYCKASRVIVVVVVVGLLLSVYACVRYIVKGG